MDTHDILYLFSTSTTTPAVLRGWGPYSWFQGVWRALRGKNMRLNESTVLVGPSLRLVPYRPEHCEQYHLWMQDPELLELTCSEPLTLAEEVANQRSWWLDEGKLTFIVCAAVDNTFPFDAPLTHGMCGDVNAFFTPLEDGDSSEAGGPQEQLQAELEVMIAERAWRRRGIGRRALLLLMHYVTQHMPRVCLFVVKVVLCSPHLGSRVWVLRGPSPCRPDPWSPAR